MIKCDAEIIALIICFDQKKTQRHISFGKWLVQFRGDSRDEFRLLRRDAVRRRKPKLDHRLDDCLSPARGIRTTWQLDEINRIVWTQCRPALHQGLEIVAGLHHLFIAAPSTFPQESPRSVRLRNVAVWLPVFRGSRSNPPPCACAWHRLREVPLLHAAIASGLHCSPSNSRMAMRWRITFGMAMYGMFFFHIHRKSHSILPTQGKS